MKHLITIEDLIDFDKNNLTDYQLIYSKIGKTWYWFYNVAVLSSVAIIIFAFIMILPFTNPDYKWLLLNIPVVVALIILSKSFKNKTTSILKEYNNKFDLNFKIDQDPFKDRRILSKIQYLTFIDYLNSKKIKLSKKDISKIIEALKHESSSTIYNYQSLTIIIAFLTIFIAAFLSSWLQIKNNINDLIKIATICITFVILMAFPIILLEKEVKNTILGRRNRYQRLIRILENYSINFKD